MDKVALYSNSTIQTSDLPKELIKQITDIQAVIPKDILFDGEDEKDWVEGGLQVKFHTTILYGVEESDKDDISKVVKAEMLRNKGIKATTGKIEYFDNEEEGHTAAVLRIESEGLKVLHDTLKATFKNKDSYPEYKSHTTIAYLKIGERLTKELIIKPVMWTINDVEMAYKGGKGIVKVSEEKVVDEPIILAVTEKREASTNPYIENAVRLIVASEIDNWHKREVIKLLDKLSSKVNHYKCDKCGLELEELEELEDTVLDCMCCCPVCLGGTLLIQATINKEAGLFDILTSPFVQNIISLLAPYLGNYKISQAIKLLQQGLLELKNK